jgi:hypothetical protein
LDNFLFEPSLNSLLALLKASKMVKYMGYYFDEFKNEKKEQLRRIQCVI